MGTPKQRHDPHGPSRTVEGRVVEVLVVSDFGVANVEIAAEQGPHIRRLNKQNSRHVCDADSKRNGERAKQRHFTG